MAGKDKTPLKDLGKKGGTQSYDPELSKKGKKDEVLGKKGTGLNEGMKKPGIIKDKK